MSQEQPPFGLPGPILAEIQRRPRSRIKFNWPPSVVVLVVPFTKRLIEFFFTGQDMGQDSG